MDHARRCTCTVRVQVPKIQHGGTVTRSERAGFSFGLIGNRNQNFKTWQVSRKLLLSLHDHVIMLTSRHRQNQGHYLHCSSLKPGNRARARDETGALVSYRSTLSTSRSSVDLSPVVSARNGRKQRSEDLSKAGRASFSPVVRGSGRAIKKETLSRTGDSFVSATSDVSTSPVRATQRLNMDNRGRPAKELANSQSSPSLYANGQRQFPVPTCSILCTRSTPC